MYFTIKSGFYMGGMRYSVQCEAGNLVFNTMFQSRDEAIIAVKALLRAYAAGKNRESYADCFDLTFHEEDTCQGYTVWTE